MIDLGKNLFNKPIRVWQSSAEAAMTAKLLLYAAQEIGAGRKQSPQSAIYNAAKRLDLEYDAGHDQWVHTAFALCRTIYGSEMAGFDYRHGFNGSGFWLLPTQRSQMVLLLTFAYEYMVTDMMADRCTDFDEVALHVHDQKCVHP